MFFLSGDVMMKFNSGVGVGSILGWCWWLTNYTCGLGEGRGVRSQINQLLLYNFKYKSPYPCPEWA